MANFEIINKCICSAMLLILISDSLVLADVNFVSVPTTIKTFENDSVLLPCYSKAPFRYVRWYQSLDDSRESGLLIDSRYPDAKTSDRIRLHNNGSLEVIDLVTEDTGEYACEVLIISGTLVKQIHNIEVQYPPTIISSPTGTVESQLGNIFEIVCETKGIPSPAISWRHNGKNKSNTYENNRRLLVEIKDYTIAGPIECIANNGVGDPAVAGIVLVVLFIPEIKLEKEIVHTKTNQRVQLDCIVHSSPAATIHWFHEGQPVISDIRVVKQEGDVAPNETETTYYTKKRYSLVIKTVRDSDMGRYECRAENRLGYNGAFITLTGRPMPAIFRTINHVTTPNSQNLIWQTESLSSIVEYKLKFRQIITGNIELQHHRGQLWRELTIPAEDALGPYHTKGYVLKGLEAAKVYECTVQARNKYGWSEISKLMRFATPSEMDIINYSTESNDYNEVNYSDETSHPSVRLYKKLYHSSSSATIHSSLTACIFFFIISQL